MYLILINGLWKPSVTHQWWWPIWVNLLRKRCVKPMVSQGENDLHKALQSYISCSVCHLLFNCKHHNIDRYCTCKEIQFAQKSSLYIIIVYIYIYICILSYHIISYHIILYQNIFYHIISCYIIYISYYIHSITLHYILFYSIRFYSVLFYSIRFCYMYIILYYNAL